MRVLPVCLALGWGLSIGLVSPALAQATKSTTTTTTTRRAPAKIDLNTATLEQLQELPGIGPVRAAEIVKARPFKSVTDLKTIKGIPTEVYADLAPRVTVTEAPAKRVMTKSSSTSTTTKEASTPLTSKVDLNTATVEQLEELPGIGPVRAAEIVKARPFKSVADLKALKGFSAPVYAELMPHVTVSQAVTTTITTKESMPKTATKVTTKSTTTTKKATTAAAAKEAAHEDDPQRLSKKKAALATGRTININTATADELQELPGIGPVRAAAILKDRPFDTIEDVMKVDGIKDGIFGQIKEHISVK